MAFIAYLLSFVSLILGASMLVRLKWRSGGKLLWPVHLLSASISPILAVAGALGGGLGRSHGLPVALVAGLLGCGISLYYIVRVTAAQPGFDLAFGKDWESQMAPMQAARLLPRRWDVSLPRTGEPRWERGLPFWTIPGSDRQLLCDIWQPPEGVSPSGLAFVYIHGGAWWILDKDTGTRPLFRQLAAQGHVIMDVANRLCPEVEIHGMLGDVKRAVAWMKANAAQYHVNPQRVVLAGGSSGAHLALLAAYTPEHPQLNPPDLQGADLSVRAVVSYYGPSDLLACYLHLGLQHLTNLPKIEIGLPGAAEMKKRSVQAGRIDTLVGGHPNEVPEAYKLASPVTHVREGCPPTLLLQGELDVITPVAATRELYRKLVECRVPAVNIVYPMTDHAFDLLLPQVSPPAQASLFYVERFLALMT